MKHKVTISLDGQLWREFRAACIKRGKSASQVIELQIHDQVLRWVVEQAQEDIKAGQVVSHEQVEKSLEEE